jgi:hypothetical protein
MVELRIAEPPNDEEYPRTYVYLVGHAFGKDGEGYSVDPVGQFGTTTEAEAHIDAINQDVRREGGLLGNKEGHPFLIFEVAQITFTEPGEKSMGETIGFYIYDYFVEKYTSIGKVSRIDCLGEYRDRVAAFIAKKREHQKEFDPYEGIELDDV